MCSDGHIACPWKLRLAEMSAETSQITMVNFQRIDEIEPDGGSGQGQGPRKSDHRPRLTIPSDVGAKSTAQTVEVVSDHHVSAWAPVPHVVVLLETYGASPLCLPT